MKTRARRRRRQRLARRRVQERRVIRRVERLLCAVEGMEVDGIVFDPVNRTVTVKAPRKSVTVAELYTYLKDIFHEPTQTT